ncbi:MAG: LD-carboxypeptidase [Bacteroidales bacterium]|nr:LD-carboxypeptidase [Bacteroidales bacterium]
MESATIAYLRADDRVALAAPARAVTPEEMAPAIAALEAWGLHVVVPDGLYERDGQLAGDDRHRAALMQDLLDDPSIAAILCVRGGYGTVRIIDRLDFTHFAQHPKWIVGYSDVTVLHSHIHATLGLPTLHATMPINFPTDGSPCPATDSLRHALFGKQQEIVWGAQPLDRRGTARGVAVGGNLSILYSLLGSRSQVDTRGKILLIEDLDEYLYHIDRMMQALRRAGMLEGLAGLVVGGLSDMHDNTIPWGHTAEEIVAEAVADYDYPVAFNAPIGHIGTANQAITMGIPLTLTVSTSGEKRIHTP